MQAETRREKGFAETESSLQTIALRRSFVSSLSNLSPQSLFSRLGPLNPMTSPIKSDDIVWMFDNTAYVPQSGAAGTAAVSKMLPYGLPSPLGRMSRSVGSTFGPHLETTLGSWGYFSPANGEWAAEFSFAVFEKDAKCSVVDVVADIAHKVGLAEEPAHRDAIEERAAASSDSWERPRTQMDRDMAKQEARGLYGVELGWCQ